MAAVPKRTRSVSKPVSKSNVVPIYVAEHRPRYEGSKYLRPLLQPSSLRARIDLTVRALRPHVGEFDAVAFSGVSGSLIGPPVALALGKELILVRKEDSNSHSWALVEGDYAAKRYIIVDDFRDTGESERYIVKSIHNNLPDAKYMGFMPALQLTEYDVEASETFHKPIPLLPKRSSDRLHSEYYNSNASKLVIGFSNQ